MEEVSITRIVVLRESYPFRNAMVRVNNTLLIHPSMERLARAKYPNAEVGEAKGLPPPLPIGKKA